MRRPDLDAWLAKADDVLTDWRGSPDAMHASARPDDADPELPLLGDNGADQTWPLRRTRPTSRSTRPALLVQLRSLALRPLRRR